MRNEKRTRKTAHQLVCVCNNGEFTAFVPKQTNGKRKQKKNNRVLTN